MTSVQARDLIVRVGHFPNVTHAQALVARNFERQDRNWFADRLGISILGPISGAHFNPAAAMVFTARRELEAATAALYVLAQVAGGIAGTLIAQAMFDLQLFQVSGTGQWIAEAVATFGLVPTILAGLRFRGDAIPWLVGLYITAAYWFTASTSMPDTILLAGFQPTGTQSLAAGEGRRVENRWPVGAGQRRGGAARHAVSPCRRRRVDALVFRLPAAAQEGLRRARRGGDLGGAAYPHLPRAWGAERRAAPRSGVRIARGTAGRREPPPAHRARVCQSSAAL